MEKRYVKLIDSPDCGESVNGHYNNVIQPLVEKIFDGAINNHAVGYQTSTDKNIDSNGFKRSVGKELTLPEYKKTLEHLFFNTDKLGFLETGFINFILSAERRLIILKGYRGTGKSELIRYVSNFMIENKRHDVCQFNGTCQRRKIKHITVSFKESELPEKNFKKSFLSRLYLKLGTYLCRLYGYGNILEEFIKDSIENKIEEFFTIEEDLIEKTHNWNSISSEKKYRHILSWIERRFKESEDRLEALYKMICFYDRQYPDGHESDCFCLIIDNIDQLRIEQQNIVVDIANKINDNIKIKVIIPVRLTTFNNIRGYASSNFWACNNVGFPPLDLCLLRIKHYLENQGDDYYKCKQLPIQYLTKFNNRLRYVYHGLIANPRDHEFERLAKTFNALAGVSIRKCLRLFRRLFLNYTIAWTDTNPKVDILLRSLYSYKYPNGKMNPDDDNRIHNIFRTNNGVLTLSKIRILNTVWESEENSYKITCKELEQTLSLYNVNHIDFLSLRDDLWRQGKRVMTMVDVGTGEGKSKKDNAILEITKSGKGYLQYLCKDLQYLQNCFEIIDLNNITVKSSIDDVVRYVSLIEGNRQTKETLLASLDNLKDYQNIPSEIDYNFESRMLFMRRILRFLYMKDVVETIHYLNKITMSDERVQQIANITNLITVPIIIGISQSVLNITGKNEYLETEREDWEELINITSAWNKLLFPESNYNKDFDKIIARIKRERKEE